MVTESGGWRFEPTSYNETYNNNNVAYLFKKKFLK